MLSIDSVIVSGGKPAYRFSNADGKTWLVPRKNLSTALQLYQPSGVKGIMLKALFPSLHWLKPVRGVLHASCEAVGLRPDICSALIDALGRNELEFSIFGGTPSIHQKITVQIFNKRKILGYCKLTDSDAIRDLFIHEKALLDDLQAAGIENIPRCLACLTLADGTSVFIQSTVKTARSFSPYRWTPLHEEFLTRMSERTLTTLKFDHSDFGRSLLALKENLHRFPQELLQTIHRSLSIVLEQNIGHQVKYSAFHADFTPWNMLIENGQLFVFDWEYGRMTYPPMLDRYHFFTQQALHVAHLSPEQLYAWFVRQPWFDNREYEMYLLDIISRFTLREEGVLPSSLIGMLHNWCGLLAFVAE